MAQCLLFKPRDDIPKDVFTQRIQVNCGNCQGWNGLKCKDESKLITET